MYKELGDIVKLRNENIKDNENPDLLYVSTANMNPNKAGIDIISNNSIGLSGKIFHEGDVLVSNIRPYFKKIWKADRDGFASPDVLNFIPRNESEINKTFLFYLLSKDEFFSYMTATAKGTKMPRGDKNAIKKYRVPAFTIKEQESIANLLSSFDDKIENNNAIIANLEEQAQTIFKSWFEDFEPFLERGYTHSDVGNIPKNWEVNTLEKISKIIDNRGKTPPLSSEQTNFPIIDVATLKSSNRLIDYGKATKYVDSTIYKTWFRSGHPQYGDILLSTVGSIGHCKLYLKDLGTIAQNVVAFRFDKDLILFMYQWFKYNHLTLVSYNIGSVQPSIKVTQINKIKLAIPSKEVLKDFNEIINPVNDLIEKLDTQNQKLVLMRDLLLPKLMSGEIRVGDVDTVE